MAKKTSKKTTKKSTQKVTAKQEDAVKEAEIKAEPKVEKKAKISKVSKAKKDTTSAIKPKEATEELNSEEKAMEENAGEELSEEEQAKLDAEKEKVLRLESHRKSGDIHKQVVAFIKPLVKVGAKFVDICNASEEKIIELGGEIGFPTNICVNEIAAHYTSPPDDERIIQDGDIVKVDIGVSVEGYVADGAFTISFNKDPSTANLILAVETAVMKGLSMIKPGIKANDVGKETQKIIKGFGFNPIKDLSGHSLEKWQVHGDKEIPNVAAPSGVEFKEGDIFALECFASTGSGNIHRSNNAYIYEYNLSTDRVPFRGKITKKVMGWIAKTKKTLPFSTRELVKEFKTGKFALRELTTTGKLALHHVLSEEKGTYVAQFEHTFIVTADGIEQFT